MEKTIKINFGCGSDYKKGYLNIDNGSMADCKADLYVDILDFDAEPETVSEILLSHVVMYLKPYELTFLLDRCYKWLVKGGKIEIETIDIEKVMRIFLEETDPVKKKDWGLNNIFGTDATGSHRWGWSVNDTTFHLAKSGFRKFQYGEGNKKPNRDYKIIAFK